MAKSNTVGYFVGRNGGKNEFVDGPWEWQTEGWVASHSWEGRAAVHGAWQKSNDRSVSAKWWMSVTRRDCMARSIRAGACLPIITRRDAVDRRGIGARIADNYRPTTDQKKNTVKTYTYYTCHTYYYLVTTHSLFHSRLKTFLFRKSIPLQPFISSS